MSAMLRSKKPDGTLSWNNIESLNGSRSGSPSMHGQSTIRSRENNSKALKSQSNFNGGVMNIGSQKQI